MTPEPAYPQRFRSRGVWWVAAAVPLFTLGLCVGNTLNPHSPVAGRVATGALCMPLVAYLVVSRRACLLVTREGLLVRRYRGTSVFVPWSDVRGLRTRSNGNGVYLGVERTDGRIVATQGLAAGSSSSPRVARTAAAVEALRPAQQ